MTDLFDEYATTSVL